MRRLLIVLASFALATCCFAQNADEPASKDEVIGLLQTMHSHDMMQRSMEAMLKPMHQMYHDRFMKDKDKLPPDFEARMSKMTDDMMKNMPFDEITQAMIPVYQKHFTSGDIAALNSFYSSPVGQKFLQETPAITGETMQTMVPIMRSYSEQWERRMQQELEEMEKSGPKKSGAVIEN